MRASTAGKGKLKCVWQRDIGEAEHNFMTENQAKLENASFHEISDYRFLAWWCDLARSWYFLTTWCQKTSKQTVQGCGFRKWVDSRWWRFLGTVKWEMQLAIFDDFLAAVEHCRLHWSSGSIVTPISRALFIAERNSPLNLRKRSCRKLARTIRENFSQGIFRNIAIISASWRKPYLSTLIAVWGGRENSGEKIKREYGVPIRRNSTFSLDEVMLIKIPHLHNIGRKGQRSK